MCTERAALWGVIGPPAYSLQPIHRKNGCLGGSGGFFPRVVPRLRRDLLFFRALWSSVGSARAYFSAAGALSGGNVHRWAALLCVCGLRCGREKGFTPPFAREQIRQGFCSWSYCVLSDVSSDPMLLCCGRGGRLKTETSNAGSVKCFRASSVVSRRISGALCGGDFPSLPGFISLHTAHLLLTHITNKDGLLYFTWGVES